MRRNLQSVRCCLMRTAFGVTYPNANRHSDRDGKRDSYRSNNTRCDCDEGNNTSSYCHRTGNEYSRWCDNRDTSSKPDTGNQQ